MNVICIESEAFDELIRRVIEIVKSEMTEPEKWVSSEEAMRILGIRSKTTLQKLRDSNEIRITQPSRKIILYDRASMMEYLERHINCDL